MPDARRHTDPDRTIDIISRLSGGSVLTAGEFATLLTADGNAAQALAEAAATTTLRVHGTDVKLRGLLEVSNICRNDCLYCGIRRSNDGVRRYSLTPDEILDSCRSAYAAGFRTFVLQGGEWPAADMMIADIVRTIKREISDSVVTLSLGERPEATYAMWREAGASRYLLRHETADPAHYSTLHPASMSLQTRIGCLESLKRLGYETGAGMMIGSPGQTADHLAADLMLLQRLRPEMVGMGPFIPHHATPFAKERPGDVGLACRIISIVRLMLPEANIPATTAMATLSPDGRNRALMAGANVVMPNISPITHRADYSLYERKAASGTEAAEGLAELAGSIATIGRQLTNRP